MQLRSVSAQSGTIDEVHEQTKRLAQQLDELTKSLEQIDTKTRGSASNREKSNTIQWYYDKGYISQATADKLIKEWLK